MLYTKILSKTSRHSPTGFYFSCMSEALIPNNQTSNSDSAVNIMFGYASLTQNSSTYVKFSCNNPVAVLICALSYDGYPGSITVNENISPSNPGNIVSPIMTESNPRCNGYVSWGIGGQIISFSARFYPSYVDIQGLVSSNGGGFCAMIFYNCTINVIRGNYHS